MIYKSGGDIERLHVRATSLVHFAVEFKICNGKQRFAISYTNLYKNLLTSVFKL